MENNYKGSQFDIVLKRLQEPRRFIQILFGPRQVGKTTLIEQVLETVNLPAIFESAVGAHLANQAFEQGLKLTYWRNGNHEVDFVLSRENRHIGIEVKSGRKRNALAGMKHFATQFNPHRTLLVGTGGMPIKEFFETPASALFQ